MNIQQAKKNVLKRKHGECLYLYESRWEARHYIKSDYFTLRLNISSHNKQSDFVMNMANRDVKWSQSIVEWQKKTGLEIHVSDGWGDREYDYLDIMVSCDKNSVDSHVCGKNLNNFKYTIIPDRIGCNIHILCFSCLDNFLKVFPFFSYLRDRDIYGKATTARR